MKDDGKQLKFFLKNNLFLEQIIKKLFSIKICQMSFVIKLKISFFIYIYMAWFDTKNIGIIYVYYISYHNMCVSFISCLSTFRTTTLKALTKQ